MGNEACRPVVPPSTSFLVRALPAVALWIGLGAAVLAGTSPQAEKDRFAGKQLLGDLNDGSRARPVHIIPLRDTEGEVIRPGDRPLLPFSTRQTCAADCHDVATISRGWHFNSTLTGVAGGRRGQPWILIDQDTATQLPLSYRAWSGCFRPQQLGISAWKFAVLFGGRTPGGISEENGAGGADLQARWQVSGELEVNFLACHDASAAYDHAEYARQIGLENFRWAETAASGIGQITGSAREMPNTFDYLLPYLEDSLLAKKPTVTYAQERFLPGAKLAFDILRSVPARRCYFCHSNADLEQLGRARWNTDEDIHLARGMTCVDCHRNGLDHAMIRGYEGEPATGKDPQAATLTCGGCHLGTEAGSSFPKGRLGAPFPKHAGIPPVHFTRLTCTACHSGPWPGSVTHRLKTSQSHGLGMQNINKAGEVLPHLYYPVFAEQEDGKIAPNRLLWPAFWGRLQDRSVQPIHPDQVKRALTKARLSLKSPPTGGWPAIDEPWLARILLLLDANSQAQGKPVYIAGGKLHRLDDNGKISMADNPAAQPYLWPLAHDVRPASQSLGARGCEDCHATEAPIFFGSVAVDSPLASERGSAWKMFQFQKNLDSRYAADFARSFRYRSWLKAAGLTSAGLIMFLLIAYLLRALARLSAVADGEKGERP